MGELIILRHGETEWSRAGRHTGRTDLPLTPRGEREAGALAETLARRTIVRVVTSPAERARRTAELAGLTGLVDPGALEVDPGLWEWDYGGYEGRTSAEIRADRPGWYLWTDGVVPGDAEHPGETLERVGERVDALLARIEDSLAEGDVAVVAHGHVLRVLTARWLGLEPAAGRLYALHTGTLSTLGYEHDRHVLTTWNVPPTAAL